MFCFVLFCFCLFRVIPEAYGGSQARSQIGAVAWPVAAALIRPLAWELMYAVGVALKKTKKKKYFFPTLLPSKGQLPGQIIVRWQCLRENVLKKSVIHYINSFSIRS